jgi:hypothetical protein
VCDTEGERSACSIHPIFGPRKDSCAAIEFEVTMKMETAFQLSGAADSSMAGLPFRFVGTMREVRHVEQ